MKLPELITKLKSQKPLLAISMVLTSWLLIHVLAFIGVLITFVYWILWLYHHSGVVCIKYWLSKEHDGYCKWCEQSVPKDIIHWPKNKLSVFYNCMFILGITLLSVVLILIEYAVINFVSDRLFTKAPKLAEVNLSSDLLPGDYTIGEIIPMPIVVENGGKPVNAVQADIAFDPRSFEVLDILTDQSFANIFIQKDINNGKGYARITGGLPNPGYSGKRGIFATVLLRTRQSGNLSVNYLPTSKILANDGKASNLLKETAPVVYAVRNESINREKEAQQEAEYQKRKTVTLENQYTLYPESKVLGASTSKELEKEASITISMNKGSLIKRYDRLVLKIWLGWTLPYL